MRRAVECVWPYLFLGAALALLATSFAGCTGAADERPGERRLAVWSEFLSDDEVRAQLPLVAAAGADLYLAVPSTRIGDPALARLVRDAVAAGVGVRAWLLLPEADGYWPNEHNVAQVRAASLALADWRDAEALPLDWIVFDMEMSLERTRAVQEVVAAEGGIAAVDLIQAGRDPDAFVIARAAYAALLDELHARGLRVMAVTYPMILDDPDDGDDDIQDGLDVPVLGLAWDEASFMVYQSLFYELSGSWHGADVVESYAHSAITLFGERAALALGIVGSAAITPVAMPYPDVATLRADQAAARAAGIGRVSIYSLDGIAQQANPAAWLDADVAPVTPGYLDADTLRALVRGLLD